MKIPLEKRTVLRFFGTEVVELDDSLCPAPGAPEGAMVAAAETAEKDPDYVLLNQYANPANTSNSGDKLVKTPLGVLWFGAPGPERMVERHARAAAPVSLNGRLFIQGENVLMCYDAYNGTELWIREILPGDRQDVFRPQRFMDQFRVDRMDFTDPFG